MLSSSIEQKRKRWLIRVRDHGSFRADDGVVVVGLALMAVPLLMDLAQGVWRTDQGAHGPLIAVLGLWLFVRQAGGWSGQTDWTGGRWWRSRSSCRSMCWRG